MKLEEEEDDRDDDDQKRTNQRRREEIKVTNIIKYFMIRLTYTYTMIAKRREPGSFIYIYSIYIIVF